MNLQKGFVNIALIVLIVIFAGVAGYFILVKKTSEVVRQTNTPTTPPNRILPDETENWEMYRNEKYGFEFKYPADMQIDEQKPTTIWYQYNATEIVLKKNLQDSSLPSITLGVATNDSIAAHKPPQCAQGYPCPFVPFEDAKLACEQFYKTKAQGAYNGTTTERYGRESFQYNVFLIDGQKACGENTWRFLGESGSYKEIVVYSANNTRLHFRVFLGYGVRGSISNANDTDLKELEQQKVIIAGSSDAVDLMKKIISTFKFY